MGVLDSIKGSLKTDSSADAQSLVAEYVDKGTKVSSFKKFMGTFEKLGKGISKLKDLYKQVTGAITDAKSVFDNLRNKLPNDYLSNLFKKLGLSDKQLALMNKLSGGLISTVDGALGDLYDIGMAGLQSYGNSILGELKANIVLPEQVFLMTLKVIPGDPNYSNCVLNVALTHDLPDVLDWLDSQNGTTYDIDDPSKSRAFTAARNGSFETARRIMKHMYSSYLKTINSPAISKKEQEIIANYKAQYIRYFIEVLETVIIYSYGNFTISNLQDFLDEFPELKLSYYGTTDTEYTQRYKISNSDIDAIAPIKTIDYFAGVKTFKKKYIVPRNKNIKKLYVYMAFTTKNYPLVNKELHDRLMYPIYDVNSDVLNSATNAFANSGIGKYLKNATEFLNSRKYAYINSVEKLLPSPLKQNLKSWGDSTNIPDFISPAPPSTSVPTAQKPDAPVSTDMILAGVTYKDFIVLRTAGVTKEELADKILGEDEKNPELCDSILYTIKKRDFDTYKLEDVEFLILHTNNFVMDPSMSQYKSILNSIIIKFLIEEALSNGSNLTLEALKSMYPDMSDSFDSFKDFYNNYKTYNDTSSDTEDTDYKNLDYYQAVISSDGSTTRIDDVGLVVTDSYGKSTIMKNSESGLSGTPIAVSIKNDSLVVLTRDSNGNTFIYVENPTTGEFVSNGTVDTSSMSILPGTGVSSASNINYYKAVYYDGKFYVINNETDKPRIDIYQDEISPSNKIGKIDHSIISSLPETIKILGVSVLPNGKLYIAYDDDRVYETDSVNLSSKIVGYDTSNIAIYPNDIGTVLNSVSVNYNDVYDFDIDNKDIIEALSKYYSSIKRFSFKFKLTDTTIEIVREEKPYIESKSFKAYAKPDDDSVRVEHDYYGNAPDPIGVAGYTESELFKKYLENPNDSTDQVIVEPLLMDEKTGMMQKLSDQETV